MTYYEMIERFNRGTKHTRLESNSLFVRRVDGVMNAVGYRFLWLGRICHRKYSADPATKIPVVVCRFDSFFPAKCFDRPE